MNSPPSFKTFLLIGLILSGLLLHHGGLVDKDRIIRIADLWADRGWFPLMVIALKIVLYTFALPGSSLYWVAGILYPPVKATFVIVMGGVIGAITAFALARRMSGGATGKIGASRFLPFLRTHSDFATLCAIRLLPAFPHSVINYGSALIGIPLHRFVLSTLIGFSVKGYLYASAIFNTVKADRLKDITSPETMIPLILLSLLFLFAKIWQRRFFR